MIHSIRLPAIGTIAGYLAFAAALAFILSVVALADSTAF
jgi:hypothetical protein